MEASCYLVLTPHRNYKGKVTGFKVSEMRTGRPSLASGEAAVQVFVQADSDVFEPEQVAVIVRPKVTMLAASTKSELF